MFVSTEGWVERNKEAAAAALVQIAGRVPNTPGLATDADPFMF